MKDRIESLLNKQQKQRMEEIQLQLLGIVAFANNDLLEELKVSKDQIQKIESLMDDCATEIVSQNQALLRRADPAGNGRELARKMLNSQSESMKNYLVKIEAVLTDDQKKFWASKFGKEFDQAKLQNEAEDQQQKLKK